MQFAALVPSTTPFSNRTRRPPAGVGPFRIVRSRPGRDVLLRRNPRFAVPGLPGAGLDQVTLRVTRRPPGRADLYAGLRAASLGRAAGDRYREADALSTYYYFLNSRVRPFHRRDVRRAVHFALDKRPLVRSIGGARPACSLVPPAMPGHGGGCPFGDPAGEPQLARARELVRRAGAAGARDTGYGSNERPSPGHARALTATLNRIGLRARTRLVEGARYFTTIGRQRTRSQAGVSNWFADVPHPANFLFLVNGRSIRRINNQNYANANDRRINQLIAGANSSADLAAVASRYSEADRRAVDLGYVVPFAHRNWTLLRSARVPPQCVVANPLFGPDLARLCVR